MSTLDLSAATRRLMPIIGSNGSAVAPESRVQRMARYAIAIVTANFGIVVVLTAFQYAMSGLGKFLLVLVGVATLALAGVWWLTRLLVTAPGAQIYAVLADVGMFFTFLCIPNSHDALLGCGLFSVSGLFVVFFLSRRWLVAHLIFATVAILWFVVDATLRSGDSAVLTVIYLQIILVSVVVPPVALERAWRVARRRAAQAGYDALTGIRNLRGMQQVLTSRVHAHIRRGDAVLVAVADIDDFKAINDQYGHGVGDTVIMSMARIINEHIDDVGFVARTGGEEFTIVMSGPDLAVLQARLEMLPTSIDCDVNNITVTISVGATDVVGNADDWEAVAAARTRADRAMYAQKRAGGNGVRIVG